MCEGRKRRCENSLLREKDLVARVECCVGSSGAGHLLMGCLEVVRQRGQDLVTLIACPLAQVHERALECLLSSPKSYPPSTFLKSWNIFSYIVCYFCLLISILSWECSLFLNLVSVLTRFMILCTKGKVYSFFKKISDSQLKDKYKNDFLIYLMKTGCCKISKIRPWAHNTLKSLIPFSYKGL